METIDLTPTPDEYRRMLQFGIENSTNKDDRQWCGEELKRVINVVEWGPQPSIDTDSSVL